MNSSRSSMSKIDHNTLGKSKVAREQKNTVPYLKILKTKREMGVGEWEKW